MPPAPSRLVIRVEPTPQSRFGVPYLPGFVATVHDVASCRWPFAAFGPTRDAALYRAGRWLADQGHCPARE